ncbi:MAG: hypothetical protein IJ497_06800, partial [Clostridia bacterium]|nr:hypothetical protein [Clostridia bacterium]
IFNAKKKKDPVQPTESSRLTEFPIALNSIIISQTPYSAQGVYETFSNFILLPKKLLLSFAELPIAFPSSL